MGNIKILKRERINHILTTVYNYPLTIVEAPMGFGKTTAVKDFLQSEKNPYLWIKFLNSSESLDSIWHQFSEKISKKEELDKVLSSLAVMVHHSDGEDVVDKGTIVYDEKGNVIGISIYVDKFSSFTLIEIPKDYFQGKTTVMKDKVASDKEWQIKFTKIADAATVTVDNVYVVDSKGGKIDVKVSYGSDNILKVRPVSSYTSGETYYLYITKAVKAKNGNFLVNELRYQFTIK